ncbi:hypothetical protein ACQPXM_21225 [Kribbella sp. CA-253562]|uniref:hypothetical protein n=1 Tax=Kribbella sp. CA-253562 TaxID=3239942 RepID=UPI003D8BCB5E
MIRRTLTAAVAALGIAAVTPLAASAGRPLPEPAVKAPAASAQAAGVCNVSVPNRVAISKPLLILPGKISGDCNRAGNSSVWLLNHPSKGNVNFIGWDATDPDLDGTWWVYSDDAIGSQTFKPAWSKNTDGATYTQNSVPVTVKLAAGAWISSSRTGDVVTLKGTSLLYSVSNNVFFKRSAAGVFQFREQGSTTWQTLKGGLWTNSKGEVSLSYRYSKVRDYRFALYSTPISWDLGSAVTTR